MSTPRRPKSWLPNVFINAPFDPQYQRLFEALVFTIMACGYRPRCALEESDSGNVRLEKLVELIRQCPRSIHDLSRTQSGTDDLPRFNMPFELGLAFGACRFGEGRSSDRIMIMVGTQYTMPKFLSDLAGNDPKHHDNDPANVIAITRSWLSTTPTRGRVVGASRLKADFARFNDQLPDIAAGVHCTVDEVRGFASYPDFVACVEVFLDLGA